MTRNVNHLEYANNVSSTILDAPLTAGATTINVGDGTGFAPSTANRRMVATIDDGTSVEIVYISAVATNALTVTRGEESTTPTEFVAGTAIEVRVTAGLLTQIDSYADHTTFGEGSVSLGKGAKTSSDGSFHVAIGNGAQADNPTDPCVGIGSSADANASGSIAIGDRAFASGSGHSIAIGSQAEADSLQAIHIGWGSGTDGARGDYAICIGSASDINTDNSVSMGRSNAVTTAASTHCVLIGDNVSILNTAPRSIGIGADASVNNSDDGIAIGNTATVDSISDDGIAIGNAATVDSNSVGAIAVGFGAYVDEAGSIAIGASARAEYADSVSIGSGGTNALAASSVALGLYAETYAEGTFRPWGPHIVQRLGNWFAHQTEASPMLGSPVMISSPPCDLGPGVAYNTLFTVQDGEVCRPTTQSATEQLYLSKGSGANATKANTLAYDGSPLVTNQISAPATEPTWAITSGVTVQGLSTEVNPSLPLRDEWIYIDPAEGLDIGVDKLSYTGGGGVLFYPTRVAFICQKHSALTGTPTFDVGNETSTTAYGTALSLSNITAVNKTQWFDITDGDAATNIVFTLNTAATVGICQGRFVVEGFYMQKMG